MAAAAPPGPAELFANPQFLANPYPVYAMFRSTNPVFRVPVPSHTGPGAWLLSRHAEVHLVLRDARFSVDRRRSALLQENADRIPPGLLGDEGGLRSMLIMDAPDHTRVRGLVNKAFTPRRIAELRPRIQEIVDELLDEAARRGCIEVIGDFAAPLPAIVIAELLGVPAEDHRRFKQWSSELIAATPVADPSRIPLFQQALERILDYMRGIIAERRRAPGADLISGMIEAQEERDALSDAELLATSNLLLIAGHETTTNLIGNGLLALLRHPAELARLRANPGLLPGAIEELLRYDSPVQATARVATEDVTLGAETVTKGALLFTLIGAANRDPEVFPEPDRLDVGREDNRHLSFGFGAHYCLGANLARLEAEVAFRALLDRFPKLALETEQVQYRPNPFLRGLVSLPVAV
jgi:cytochrome P450